MTYDEIITAVRYKLRDDPNAPVHSNDSVKRAIDRAVLNFHTWATQMERATQSEYPISYYIVETNWSVAWNKNGVWGNAAGIEMVSINPLTNQPGLPDDFHAVIRCVPPIRLRQPPNQTPVLPLYRVEQIVDTHANPQQPTTVLRFIGAPSDSGTLPVHLIYIRKPKLGSALSDKVDIPLVYQGALTDAVAADLKGSLGEIPEPFQFRHTEIESRLPPDYHGGPVS